ncbi:MAG: lytic transglycosylase domain-containing protein [Pseudomonadota bacterium]
MLLRTTVPIIFTCIGALTAYALYLGSQEKRVNKPDLEIFYTEAISASEESASVAKGAASSTHSKTVQKKNRPPSFDNQQDGVAKDNVLMAAFIESKLKQLDKDKTASAISTPDSISASKQVANKNIAQQKPQSAKAPSESHFLGKEAPAPKFVSPSEKFKPYSKKTHVSEKQRIAYDAKMTLHLKKMLSYSVNAADAVKIKKAMKLSDKGKFAKAWEIADTIENKVGQKLVKWDRLTKEPGAFQLATLQTFWRKNPDWPDLDNLREAAEEKLLILPQSINKKYFDVETPITSTGMVAKANLLYKTGKKKVAISLIRDIWHRKSLTRETEKAIISRYKTHLTSQDHRRRVDNFLYRGKSTYVASALKAARYLSKVERRKVNVRAAGLRRLRKVGKMIDKLSNKDKLDAGILFTRIQFARRRKRDQQAWDLFKKVNYSNAQELGVPDAWWKERRLHVRRALDEKKYKIAYRIAKNHGPLSINHLNEARFMAGWIALRYLRNPKAAYKHFKDLNNSADGPRSTSRSKYWMGRTALALGQKKKARAYFKKGARFFNTYYGQLSRQSLKPKATQIYIPLPPKPSAKDIAIFYRRDAVKAVMIAHKLGLRPMVKKFLGRLRYQIIAPGELMLLAHLAKRIEHNQQLVRVGKLAMFKGIEAGHYAYPVHAIPRFKPLRSLPEKAFYYAIARQESEFNKTIVSPAGAEGLLQIMPTTARYVAKQHKVKYRRAKLRNAPSYNVALGTAYIADRIDDFNGSYIKTIAAYNAGQGRVRQWVKRYGNPVNVGVDPIDWVERIPFTETRNYVKKVLANIQIYRSRLGKGKHALKLRKDLYRSRWDAHVASQPLVHTN